MYFPAKTLSAALILTLLTPAWFLAPPPHTAKAQVLGTGILETIEVPGPLITAVYISAGADVKDQTQKSILNHIAWLLAQTLLQSITESIVTWINSGFQGNPAFVTDLEGFLLDVGDRAAGQYVYGSQLAFLCSPFALDIRASLLFSRTKQIARCRLTGIVDNLEGFLTSSLVPLQTLDQWVAITQDPYTNPYMAYANTKPQLDAHIAGATGRAGAKLTFGRGFFEVTTCQTSKSEAADAAEFTGELIQTDRERGCVTGTPGAVVEAQLNKALGLSEDKLVVADSFNEIIEALFAQLAKQVLTGAGGLLGLNAPSPSYGGSTYLEQAQRESAAAFNGSRGALQDTLQAAVGDELLYRGTIINSLESVTNAESSFTAIAACYRDKVALGTLSPSDVAIANDRIAAASSTIASQITPRRSDLLAADARSAESIATLNGLRVTAQSARDASELNRVAAEYQRLVATHAIHDQFDLLTAERASAGIRNEMDSLAGTAREHLEECRAFPPPPSF